jgi:hypothetical protein
MAFVLFPLSGEILAMLGKLRYNLETPDLVFGQMLANNHWFKLRNLDYHEGSIINLFFNFNSHLLFWQTQTNFCDPKI